MGAVVATLTLSHDQRLGRRCHFRCWAGYLLEHCVAIGRNRRTLAILSGPVRNSSPPWFATAFSACCQLNACHSSAHDDTARRATGARSLRPPDWRFSAAQAFGPRRDGRGLSRGAAFAAAAGGAEGTAQEPGRRCSVHPAIPIRSSG